MNRSANLQDYRQLAERLCRRLGIEAPGNHPVDILQTLERYCDDDATMDTQPKPYQAFHPQPAKRGRPRNDKR